MWARVSSFMQDEQTNQTEHQPADCDSSVENNSNTQGNFQQADSEWRPRFSFSLGLGEILYNWGFLRRKPSQTDSNTDSPSKLGTNLSSSSKETIELNDLNSFTSNEVQNLTWKTASSLTLNSNIFSSPLQINKSNLLCESDTLRAVSSVSSLFDSTSLTSFIWEEIEDLETGLGHAFVVLDTNFPMWCDRCGDLLWGLHGEYLRCQSKFNTVFSAPYEYVFTDIKSYWTFRQL